MSSYRVCDRMHILDAKFQGCRIIALLQHCRLLLLLLLLLHAGKIRAHHRTLAVDFASHLIDDFLQTIHCIDKPLIVGRGGCG